MIAYARSLRVFCVRKIEIEELLLQTQLYLLSGIVCTERQWEIIASRTEMLSTNYGFRFFFKIHRHQDVTGNAVKTVIFKGNDGAGRTDPGAGSLEDNFSYIRRTRPEIDIIPSGGISTADQVRYYMDRGALAVGIGR